MKVNLLYGKKGKLVELPDDGTFVIRPKNVAPVSDEETAVFEALRAPIGSPPLREIVSATDTVAIVFSDITRPMPYSSVLPPLMEEISIVPDDQIVFINATGSHRPNTQEELIEILGDAIVDRYRIHQHDCNDETNLINLGKTSRGHEIWINREYMQSSIKILTGYIEPHLFAGFSGGPKAVLPGIAGVKSIMSNHGSEMIGDPKSTFTHTKGNLIWEEMFEVATLTNPTFLLNVTQTEDRRITGVFAGELSQAHERGIEFLKSTAMVPVDGSFDIVISTAGGYPLDISMYQSVKGIAVTANIVKDGGAILLVSDCEEGLPDYGEYGDIMRKAETPQDLLGMIHSPGFSMQDQWDAQIQAQICQRAKLHIYSEGLSNDEIRQVFGIPSSDVENTVAELLNGYGSGARIAVLPAGALAIPYVDGA
jgi:nickel-dependent lactate racemase